MNTDLFSPGNSSGAAVAAAGTSSEALSSPEVRAAPLERLLEHPELWRAGQLGQTPETRSSGFTALDEHLPGRGWPRAALAEFLFSTSGIGELRLLAPLMRTLSREEVRWIAWINPPFIPYAPALSALGIDVSKILLIHPKTHQEALWALERASGSGTCSIALAWLDEQQLQLKDTRRLQLAARKGGTLTCLFRPAPAAATASMAELRLGITAAEPGEVVLDIRKRRGGWPVEGIRLQIEQERYPREIREQLSLWRHLREQQAAARTRTAEARAHTPSRDGASSKEDGASSKASSLPGASSFVVH